jgi:hypothetical protein
MVMIISVKLHFPTVKELNTVKELCSNVSVKIKKILFYRKQINNANLISWLTNLIYNSN